MFNNEVASTLYDGKLTTISVVPNVSFTQNTAMINGVSKLKTNTRKWH